MCYFVQCANTAHLSSAHARSFDIFVQVFLLCYYISDYEVRFFKKRIRIRSNMPGLEKRRVICDGSNPHAWARGHAHIDGKRTCLARFCGRYSRKLVDQWAPLVEAAWLGRAHAGP